MKNILLSSMVLLSFSCAEIDNYDMPSETFGGRFIIKGSGALLCEAGFSLKMEELSWSENPTPFYIPMKPDGTFLNTKMFAGHYRVQPHGDVPFWPIEPIEIDIKGKTYHDFEVVPYMNFKDVTYKVEGNTLRISFKMYPSIKEGLPKILQIQPFVSLANRDSDIAKFSQDLKQNLNIETWTDDMAEEVHEFVIPNIPDNIYFVRIGVRVEKGTNTWNICVVNQTEGEKGFIKVG